MDTTALLIKMTGALALILGIMFLIVSFLRRLGRLDPRNSTSYIEVIENRILLPKRHLSLVRIAGSYFLIGSTEQEISLLGSISEDDLNRFDSIVDRSSVHLKEEQGAEP